MPTVKTQAGKVITKAGKVSCTCCSDPSIGCPTSTCVPTAGDGNTAAVCLISYANALLYKQGGTWSFDVSASLDASFDLAYIDQRYKTIVSGSGNTTITTSESCNISAGLNPVSLSDSGGLFRLSTDELLVPSPNATLQGAYSIAIRETSTTPRAFCMSINLLPRSINGNYHALNIGLINLTTTGNTTLTVGSCVLSFQGVIQHKGLSGSGGTNPQGTGIYDATVTFTPSAP